MKPPIIGSEFLVSGLNPVIDGELVVDWPLIDQINVSIGYTAPPIETRSTVKYLQKGCPSLGDIAGTVVPINNIEVSKIFDGICFGAGVTIEGSGATDLTNVNDVSVGWIATQCSVDPGTFVSPYNNEANLAQKLIPTNPGGNIRQNTGINCDGVTVQGGCWVRGDTAGHTARIYFERVTGTEFYFTDFVVDTVWKWVSVEGTFASVGANNLVFRIYPDIDGTNNPTYIRLPYCVIDTKKTLDSPCVTTRGWDQLGIIAGSVPNLHGDRGTVYLEAYPLHDPQAGIRHLYWGLGPINANPLSYLIFLQAGVLNNLGAEIFDGVATVTILAPATPGNWGRQVWHKVAVKYDATEFKLFLDGVLFAQQAGPIPVGNPTLPPASIMGFNADPTNPPSIIVRNYKSWSEPKSDAEMISITS